MSLLVADMNAAHRITQCRRNMPKVFQPTDVFLLFDGDACRIDLLLESVSQPLNFFWFPELDRRQTSGRPSGVTAKLECIKIPQIVWFRGRPRFARRLLTLCVISMGCILSL